MGMEIIDFKATKCKHCYKCVRYCGVKAIQVKDERAVIMPDKCILCGHCLKICPQSANTLKSDLIMVRGFLLECLLVVVSIAPSYLGLLKYKTIGQVRGALLRLGFEDVRETSEGAAFVTAEYAKLLAEHKMENIITTCCPSANDLVEIYYPLLIPYLAPVVSPMIAHGKLLKEELGRDVKVVFLGPCIAKKKEALDLRHEGYIDAVLNFNDINKWLEEEDIVIEDCEDRPFTALDKTSIHEEIISLGMEENFIGGHPMAGSEKNGFANSKAHLIENAYYILTPSAKVSEEKINAYRNFVSSLKALPIVLDYRQHDCITGTISHLPHIIASTLVNFVRDTDTKEELMKALAAGGFKDITRIASSSPVMWQQICLKNGKNISHILGQYIEALIQAKLSIDTEDENALYTLFESSRDYRNSMPNTSAGPIKKQFAVYCDIIDETGGIATIATILASNNISIKNIGIIHNREFEEGVLRIEFYDESSSSKASALLKKYRYIVYEV